MENDLNDFLRQNIRQYHSKKKAVSSNFIQLEFSNCVLQEH